MHDRRIGGGIGHSQVRRQRRQRGIGIRQRGVGLMCERARARHPHTVHVDLTETAQLGDEFGHMHPGPAVHLRRVLAGHHRHSHTADRSANVRCWALR